MKHYYESEILNQLMERDGLNNPSSTPVYESEIREQLLNQVTPSYPKLNDYEPEWLMYNHTKHLPADFPVESATNVTQATFDNVVPYAYGKAVLKGQTLVNNIKSIENSEYNLIDYNLSFVDNTKSYYVKFDTSFPANEIGFLADAYTWNVKNHVNNLTNGYTILTPDKNKPIYGLRIRFNSNVDTSYSPSAKLVCIEYQEGMENWDIPYFEGMQSVKMLVLTTTGKNLINKIMVGSVNSSNGTISLLPNANNAIISDFIEINSDKSYVFSGINKSASSFIAFYDRDKQYISRTTGKSNDEIKIGSNTTINIPSNTKYIVFTHYGDALTTEEKLSSLYQFEEGSTATPYEPYKTNILTVNEDVTLRGIGDVKDTLDCLTGEMTQRIEQVVLSGNSDETWISKRNIVINSIDYLQYYLVSQPISNKNYSSSSSLPNIISDKGITDPFNGLWMGGSVKTLSVREDGGLYYFCMNFPKNEDIKEWLSQNPITVQYQLATESIKTVDLTCKDQDGETSLFMPIEGTNHLETLGHPIKPQMDVEIPVEAITQNLASFIVMEGEDNE